MLKINQLLSAYEYVYVVGITPGMKRMRKMLQKQCVSRNNLATTREVHSITLNIFALLAKQLHSRYTKVEFILYILLPAIYSANDWETEYCKLKYCNYEQWET